MLLWHDGRYIEPEEEEGGLDVAAGEAHDVELADALVSMKRARDQLRSRSVRGQKVVVALPAPEEVAVDVEVDDEDDTTAFEVSRHNALRASLQDHYTYDRWG